MKRVLILGIDGYIGYPLALHLLTNDYEVCGLDNLSRRKLVTHAGGNSLTPISTIYEREKILKKFSGFIDLIARINMSDSYHVDRVLREYRPDTIVHLAEQPSAPWSMKNVRASIETQHANVIGTLSLLWAMKDNCPDAHLIKLGTMGEYGTPNCDIPEGVIPTECLSGNRTPAPTSPQHCSMSGLLFPRQPGSFYHLSKVHDTYNIKFACDTWNLRSTDIMQGVVFGVKVDDQLTRFDYDQYFGTVINRFCAQAISGHPLTVYGRGGQRRGFLPLKDSIQCLRIAIDNPPKLGEYRTFNQFENVYRINGLAKLVSDAAENLGIMANIEFLPNPRIEEETHYYEPAHQKLLDLGYKPTTDITQEVIDLLRDLLPFKDRVNKSCIKPTTTWS